MITRRSWTGATSQRCIVLPKNRPITTRRFPILQCPSDTRVTHYDGITSHNYVANFGNTTHYHHQEFNGLTFAGAPFFGTENLETTRIGKFKDITDGLSKTLMLSEQIQGEGRDLRGFSWWGWAAGFETSMTPNSAQPDVMQQGQYCDKTIATNPPCTGQSSALPMHQGARSRHPGGVMASHCDGSAKFYTNDVFFDVWQGLGTTQGEEVRTEN